MDIHKILLRSSSCIHYSETLLSAPMRCLSLASLEEWEDMGIKPLFCEVQVIPFHPQEHQLSCFVHLLQPQAILKEEKHDLVMHIEHNFLGESQWGRKSHFGMRDDLEQSLRKEQSLNMWKEILSRGEITPNSAARKGHGGKQLPVRKGHAPRTVEMMSRARLWGLELLKVLKILYSLEGKLQTLPSTTYLFVQQGLLQRNGVLGLAAFVKPKPLSELKTKTNQQKTVAVGLPAGQEAYSPTPARDVLLQTAQHQAYLCTHPSQKVAKDLSKDKPETSKEEPKCQPKTASALTASPQRSEDQP